MCFFIQWEKFMRDYNLGFISNEEIFSHVKETVSSYKKNYNLDLAKFNSNIVDPIKLSFDSIVYKQSMEETIRSECIRQIDKANSNSIGYFHQNIFKYAKNGWDVPKNGKDDSFDVTNHDKHIFCEIKNKHNTMNSASAQKTYMRMQNKILKDDQATCYLVEIISKKSQDAVWEITNEGEKFHHNRIRRISVDRFYNLVFEDSQAFLKLCQQLPNIIEDVVNDSDFDTTVNTVYAELSDVSPDLLKSLYLLAFKTYEGFDSL